MINRLPRPPLFTTALIVMTIMVVLRWMAGGYDFSYYFTAGSDFVNPLQTPVAVITQPGQGYDGQFFYRLALDPFNWEQNAYGVTIDYPQYRVQRIGYPFLAWILSAGGTPSLVPFALVFLNLLSFAGIIYFFKRISEKFKASPWFHFSPLLVCGIYMSTAKSLSEVTELCFFLGALAALLDRRLWMFAMFAALAILTRETSAIPISVLAILCVIQTDRQHRLKNIFILSIPFIVFISWKLFLAEHFKHDPAPPSLRNFTWPIKGMIDGFMININFSSGFHAMQSVFWLMYFIWQTWFSLLVFKASLSKRITLRQPYVYPVAVYFVWLVFSLFFSAAIYGDDWSFVRVLALMNLSGFLVIMAFRQNVNRNFLIFSAGLVMLTIVRMVLRP